MSLFRNKLAGFWIRFLCRAIDVVLIIAFMVGVGLSLINRGSDKIFKETWMFYLWFSLMSCVFFVYFIVVPSFSKGRTFGMWLFRIKIIFKGNNKIKSMVKRELLYSGSWIFMSLLFLTLINHTLIGKFADNELQSNWEKLRSNIVISSSTLLFVIQFIFSISIIVRKSKGGLHDKFSNTETVWKNKFVEFKKQVGEIIIEPRPVLNNEVTWM